MISWMVKGSYCGLSNVLDFLDFAESSPETIEWDEVDSNLSFPLYLCLHVDTEIDFKRGEVIAAACRVVFTLSRYPNIS